MRSGQFFGGILGVVAFGALVHAEPSAVEKKTIVAPEVEVRSGPSMNSSFYATNKLRRGDVVEVIKDKPAQAGWLAIKPPTGSFSWVNATLVSKENDHTGTIAKEDTPVLIGSSLTNSPPSVRTTPLRRGTVVVILDKPLQASDGSRWLPIQPHATEVRYIPMDAFKDSGAVPAIAAKPSEVQDPRIRQAEQAVVAGRTAEAEQLYKQVANDTRDSDVKILCLNRLATLHQAGTASGSPRVDLTGRIIPAQGNQATSLYGNTPAWNAPGGSIPQSPQWSGPGWMTRANFQIDGKQVYRLVNTQGCHMLYVTAQPGVPLEQHVNRWVDLYGPIGYRGEAVRACYMTASYAKPVQ